EILEPLNSATKYFSSMKYPTIASIHPLIEVMKVNYTKDIDVNEYENNNNEDLQMTPNYDSESDSSDEEEESNISFNAQEDQFDNNFELIIKEIQNIIYNSLFEYWDHPSQTCFLSTLLNPG
ncbi:8954_t:CDS:2, partial [Racocetra fulgida]